MQFASATYKGSYDQIAAVNQAVDIREESKSRKKQRKME